MTTFQKTARALRAFDKAYPGLHAAFFRADTNEEVFAADAALNEAAVKVAEAFADDTCEINSRSTVISCVRPGPPDSDTWLRRLVAKEAVRGS